MTTFTVTTQMRLELASELPVWPPQVTSAGFPNLFLRWCCTGFCWMTQNSNLHSGLKNEDTIGRGELNRQGAFTAPSVEPSNWITFAGAPLWTPLAVLEPCVILQNLVTNSINTIRKLLKRQINNNNQKNASKRPVMQQLCRKMWKRK